MWVGGWVGAVISESFKGSGLSRVLSFALVCVGGCVGVGVGVGAVISRSLKGSGLTRVVCRSRWCVGVGVGVGLCVCVSVCV